MNICFWNEVVEGKRRGIAACLLRILLCACSLIYRLGVRARNLAYDAGVRRARRLPRPVISVGNIVTGGVGKTPFVKFLAGELLKRGMRVAILSRGYGGRSHGAPHLVADGGRLLLSAAQAGDETVMLARGLPGAIVVADPSRFRAGKMAAERFAVDLYVLDDGFQHRALARDVNILLLDCEKPFDNGRLLPAGKLREPKSGLRRADLIVLTRCRGAAGDRTRAALRRFNRVAPVFSATHEASCLVAIPSGTRASHGSLKGKRVATFSAIAQPEDFARTLMGCSATVVSHRVFPDHHFFSEPELDSIMVGARAAHADAVITTAKDAVRLPGRAGWPLPLFSLEIQIAICEGAEKMIESVLNILDTRRP